MVARSYARYPASVVARGAIVIVLCMAAVLFLRAHANYPILPAHGSLDSGWWNWTDQGRYLTAAQALARLDATAADQWYEPAYASLAAPFVHVTPADPFLLPDLAAYLLSCWLFGTLGKRLFGLSPWAHPLAATIFVLATMWLPLESAIWVVPWTTTPVTPLVLGGLVGALAFAERPRPGVCFATALCACGVGAFRPADIVVVAMPASVLMLWTLVRRRVGARRVTAIIAAGFAGALLPITAALALHVAIWGWEPSLYEVQSKNVGFAWLLIPLRWVLIVVGPRPLLTEGAGLAKVFPWIMPGVAGMTACIAAPGRPGRAPHLFVIAAAAMQCALLLAYRDLHPTGLWRYNNYHYFKWLLPTFALYSALLLQALADRARRLTAVIAAAAVTIGLFCWRPELKPDAAAAMGAEIRPPHGLTLRAGTRSLRNGLLVGADGPPLDLLLGIYLGTGAGRVYWVNDYFKAYPRPGGFLFIALRPLPAGLTITFPASVTLDAGLQPIGVRQEIAFGLPCWHGPCRGHDLLPGPALALGHPLAMGDEAAGYLVGEWSTDAEPGGRWTQGRNAGLLARVTDIPPGQALVVRVRGHGYVPSSSKIPARIAVAANGHEVASWAPGPGPDRDLVARIPPVDMGPNGLLRLDFRIENPRSPASQGEGADRRRLGLFVQSLTIEAAGRD